MCDFKIKWACSASSISNHKYDFGPKLHNTRFNFNFITSILKLPKYRIWSVKIFIDVVLSWFEIKFIHFFWGGGGKEFWKQKLQNLPHDILFVFHFRAIWLVTLNKPWNLIGCFVFSVVSLAEKKMRFKAKNGVICE